MEAVVLGILNELLDAVGVSRSGILKDKIAGQTVFSIQAQDTRPLIGMHGDTVHAIDHLVKKIAEKRLFDSSHSRKAMSEEKGDVAAEAAEESDTGRGLQFLVDVNDYRAKQIKDLETKALMMAERARSFQYDVELSPMSSYERLIIHTVLADAPNVKTESQGEGRNRRVVIKYAAS